MSAPTSTESQQFAAGQMPKAISLVVELLERNLGNNVVGVYLYGSCLGSGLRHQSDVDILVLVSQPITGTRRLGLVADLLKVSGWNAVDATSRPLDISFAVVTEVVPWRFPPSCELLFGEWLRDDLTAQRIGPPSERPDLAILFTTLLQNGRALIGPPASSVLEPVPARDLHRAIVACLPSLLDNLKGDERNVILTLARMWATLATNQILSKDQAADWVLQRLPAHAAPALILARTAYLGEEADDWSTKTQEVDSFVQCVVTQIGAIS
jgi:streptomycin 3"-adenylyltransferase